MDDMRKREFIQTGKVLKKMEWRGTGLTRDEGEEKEKYRVGKQQIEMGKVSNGMKWQRKVLWFGGIGNRIKTVNRLQLVLGPVPGPQTAGQLNSASCLSVL